MAATYASTRSIQRTATQSSFASTSTSVTVVPMMPSADGPPVATSSLANKQASQTYGMYPQCVELRARLERVRGFADTFLNPDKPFMPDGETASELMPKDPVSQILHCLRLGSSLCYLFNKLGLQHQLVVDLEQTRKSRKACKHSVAKFIMACSTDLPGLNPDGGFLLTELYGSDTTGTAKAISCVKNLVDKLEERGQLTEPLTSSTRTATAPLDERAKVVKEMIESERKYVQDLETLQAYREELLKSSAISADTAHQIFMNLNSLLNFQRQFLIGMEAYYDRPVHEQRFGYHFLSMEEEFSVYEPFCANFSSASEVALLETPNLAKVNSLEPNHELPTFLIKPIQRICKYPLLMQTLVKATDPTSQFYREDVDAVASIKRVTEKVNEVKRQHENDLAVRQLEQRVEDWKGHDIRMFGALILEDTFMVIKADTEREYHVYLFERIILCCKTVGTSGGKKGSKSNSILKRPASKQTGKLQLKGRIFVTNVQHALPMAQRESGPPQYVLKIIWRGDVVEEHFSIKCRTAENMQKWQTAINKAVDDALARPRSRSTNSIAGSIRRGLPNSAWPPTPMSEMSPSLFSATSEHAPSLYSVRSQSNLYDQDYDSEEVHYDSNGGRMTPSSRRGAGTHSMPLAQRKRESESARPRAQTEDSSSTVINNWKEQMPPGTPALPRSSTASMAATAKTESSDNLSSLRSSTSSRVLRNKPSVEWGSAGFGRQPIAPGAYEPELPSISRNASHASVASSNGVAQKPPLLRSRSASSPHAYQGPPPLSKSASQQSWNDREPPVPPLTMMHKHSTNGTGSKRFSSSSASTDRSSGDSSQSQGATHTAATSPSSTTATPGSAARGFPLGLPPKPTQPGGYAVKVKISHQGDTFVVVVLNNVSYAELAGKILNKLRLCSKLESDTLRLRYVDEDEDRILIRDDDDIAMAFDSARAHPVNGQATLVLYAD